MCQLLVFVVIFLVETSSGTDIKYLQFKWGELFVYLDVNNDSMLTTVDVELAAENYIQINNLTDREVYIAFSFFI